jgi:hypothetical protein
MSQLNVLKTAEDRKKKINQKSVEIFSKKRNIYRSKRMTCGTLEAVASILNLCIKRICSTGRLTLGTHEPAASSTFSRRQEIERKNEPKISW